MKELNSLLDRLSKSELTLLGIKKHPTKSEKTFNSNLRDYPIPTMSSTLTTEFLRRTQDLSLEYMLEVIEEKGFYHIILNNC